MLDPDSVEILMATCNGDRFVEEQVTSILTQTHANLCLRIRDDASDDHTPDLLRQLHAQAPERIILDPPSEHREGAAVNFGTLLDRASARYIMFADQDDVWLPDKVSRTLAFMRELEAEHGRHTPVLVHTDLRVVGEQLEPIASSLWTYQHLMPERFTSLNRLLIQNGLTGCTVMINAALATRCMGGVPRRAIMHDWWIALVAAAFGVVTFLPEATLLYRQHSADETGAKNWSLPDILRPAAATFFSDDIPVSLGKTYDQAQEFIERYGDFLAPEKLDVVSAYVELPNQNWIQRRQSIFRHGFLKADLVRSLALLLRV